MKTERTYGVDKVLKAIFDSVDMKRVSNHSFNFKVGAHTMGVDLVISSGYELELAITLNNRVYFSRLTSETSEIAEIFKALNSRFYDNQELERSKQREENYTFWEEL